MDTEMLRWASAYDWFFMYDLLLDGVWVDTKQGFYLFFSDFQKLLEWAGY